MNSILNDMIKDYDLKEDNKINRPHKKMLIWIFQHKKHFLNSWLKVGNWAKISANLKYLITPIKIKLYLYHNHYLFHL